MAPRWFLPAMSSMLAALALAATAVPAQAATSPRKSIWGPVTVDGVSQFPIYEALGVGLYQTVIGWNQVAPTRPANPRNPADPAYRWPAEVDTAVAEGARHGIRVAVQLTAAPRWANGGKSRRWAPLRPSDFGDFAEAAARRYPAVHIWVIWGEPSRRHNFMPLSHEQRDRPLSRKGRQGPRLYARILDSAYGRLKAVSGRNLVVGGNTFTTGDVSPRNFIRALRLPSGRPPRMDLYGHNPFSARRPDLRKGALGHGFADFSDLDLLARWIDGNLGRTPSGRKIRLFLSEFFLPTDHANHEFNFYVSRRTQASWLASALAITRRWSRIYTLGWLGLYDDPPRPGGDEVNRGLIDRRGRKKPAYNVFKRG